MTDIYSSAKRAEIMSRIRGRDTQLERAIRLTVSDLPGRPDLVFRRLGTVVFAHGCHGHDRPKGRSRAKTNAGFWARKLAENRKRDAKNMALLKSQGWRTVIVWECETKDIERLRSSLARKFGA
jgi:DNA mismatch endonuclease (patch repair protein)